MSKHTCESVRIRIPDYLDGKLQDAEEDALLRHLESCPSCAQEAADLRPLMQDLLPTARTERADVDWARFSVALNDAIDRRQRRRRILPLRSRVLLPAAAALLAFLAIWIFSPADRSAQKTVPVYAVTIDEEDVDGITPEDVAAIEIEDITITDASGGDALFVSGQPGTTLILEDSIATSELRGALAEDIGLDAIVTATMEYFSTDAVIEAISDEDVALLASAIDFQDIAIP